MPPGAYYYGNAQDLWLPGSDHTNFSIPGNSYTKWKVLITKKHMAW